MFLRAFFCTQARAGYAESGRRIGGKRAGGGWAGGKDGRGGTVR